MLWREELWHFHRGSYHLCPALFCVQTCFSNGYPPSVYPPSLSCLYDASDLTVTCPKHQHESNELFIIQHVQEHTCIVSRNTTRMHPNLKLEQAGCRPRILPTAIYTLKIRLRLFWSGQGREHPLMGELESTCETLTNVCTLLSVINTSEQSQRSNSLWVVQLRAHGRLQISVKRFIKSHLILWGNEIEWTLKLFIHGPWVGHSGSDRVGS